MASHSSLPATHRALVLHTLDTPLQVETRPMPQVTPGSVVVRVLAANVLSYGRELLDGTRPYPYPKPYVPGGSAVGKIAAVGSDCSIFSPGQLVLVGIMTRARDDASASYLMGIHQGFSETTAKLASDEWRDSTYAEFAKVPLENVYALDEERLLGDATKGGLGYTVEDLPYLYRLLVPFGGFRDVGLKVGETILIGPATGPYGTAAVRLALALGANVVAMGRNGQVLEKLAATSDRVKTVQLTGDVKDGHGGHQEAWPH